MDAFEYARHNANPGKERLRLWNIEKKPEIEGRLKEMKRDSNALLGEKIKQALLHRPDDLYTVLKLCREAEEADADLESLVNESEEAEAERLLEVYRHAALTHPGEPDPSAIIRDRLKGSPDAGSSYCSPVLMDTLLREGSNRMPNTHRKRLELDFPTRVEALLDFHCIAFHADINVMKELYDEDVDKDKRQDILDKHRSKMEELMVRFSKEIGDSWAEEKERLRLRSAQAESVDLPRARDSYDWSGLAPPPIDNSNAGGARKRVHMEDPPTVLGAPARRAKIAQPALLRGILKKPSVGVPDLGFDEDDDDDPAISFFQEHLIRVIPEESAPLETENTYTGPEIVAALPAQPRTYELWRPDTRLNNYTAAATPRTLSEIATPLFPSDLQSSEGKGKGKGRVAWAATE
ncbi:hypothetical protein B0H15DRAFT_825873 [Mycena belliarum]|uniref:Uncharacterized protein n=1 Tax=Mycena belliarum TaxID=1033014 RepID=A0AAD6XQR4_9AGAR|nr:hypothetical protein B0H15DRAFT_825873 [Mycena belliae]